MVKNSLSSSHRPLRMTDAGPRKQGHEGKHPMESARNGTKGFTLIELLACQPKPVRRRQAQSGFTLIELLVVIAVIALLVSILVPSLSSAKELARSVLCRNNLRNIGTGYWMYEVEYGAVPPHTMSGSYAPNNWAHYTWMLVTAGVLEGETLPGYDGAKGELFKCPSKGMIKDKYREDEHWRADYSPNVTISNGYNDGNTNPWFSLSRAQSPAELYFVGENKRRWVDIPYLGGGGWKPGGAWLSRGISPPAEWYSAYEHEAHVRNTNMLFADNHVESLPGLEPNERYVYREIPWWDDPIFAWR